METMNDRYKARLLAKRCSEILGIDVKEIFFAYSEIQFNTTHVIISSKIR